MPYMFVSTQIRLESGPTVVGDEESDPALMSSLQAVSKKDLGNNFSDYVTPWSPRKVLDTLEQSGWSVVGTTGVGQTMCWTLHKPVFFENDRSK